MTQTQRRGYATYTLKDVQRYPSGKAPAAHQEEALRALKKWFRRKQAVKGGILVLPTGGGKTFTATRFLTEGPLSQGHKVLWLAHTHHLLDQAFSGLDRTPDGKYELGHVGGVRKELTLRTVSGTLGHGKVAEIKAKDDVVIITLQTLARAMEAKVHPGLKAFLTAANETGLTVVFDECHHAPAPSFRHLIEALRAAVPDLHLLGLTATPTYSDDRRQGHLKKLFPQEILFQVSPQELMLAGILARPIVEEPPTNIRPNFSDQDYQEWLGSYRDIPEKVIAHLASNRDRNTLIAETYAQNRDKYGQTLIFADRWYQCTALVELLRQRGVRADAVFTHQDADPGSVEARNARRKDENEDVLTKFRNGELDVLVNIRMLTEGTDVPNVKSVFLTRQTTSRILLTQMIGRALRGPRFGGTAEAYVVAFIDEWKQHVNWARWDDLVDTGLEESETQARKQLPIDFVSTALIAHLASELDAGEMAAIPFLTLMPVGWYAVSYDASVEPKASGAEQSGQTAKSQEDQAAITENEEGTDNIETVRQLIPVFDRDLTAYQGMFKALDKVSLDDFEDVELSDRAHLNIRGWSAHYFLPGERLTRLHEDVLSVVRHRARNGQWPAFTPFEAREQHNMDAVAQSMAFDRELSRLQEDRELREEFNNPDLLWGTLYRNYDQFKRQYDASVNRLLYLRENPEEVPDLGRMDETFQSEEVAEKVKRAVRKRDHQVCLCCGRTKKLRIDHIRSRYAGGSHDLDNLQLLCEVCNGMKGTREIDFRRQVTPVDSKETVQSNGDWIFMRTAEPASDSMLVHLKRITNMAYQGAVVAGVSNFGTTFEVQLHKGTDPTWVQPLLNQAVALWTSKNPYLKETMKSIRAVDPNRRATKQRKRSS
ncbi:DEAD/DEAH box helicase family protein [Deinococcus sp. UYEF24]